MAGVADAAARALFCLGFCEIAQTPCLRQTSIEDQAVCQVKMHSTATAMSSLYGWMALKKDSGDVRLSQPG